MLDKRINQLEELGATAMNNIVSLFGCIYIYIMWIYMLNYTG